MDNLEDLSQDQYLRHEELYNRCGKRKKILPAIQIQVNDLHIDSEGIIHYDNRLFEPRLDLIDGYGTINIIDKGYKSEKGKIEVILLKHDDGNPIQITHLGVFLGNFFNDNVSKAAFSCIDIPVHGYKSHILFSSHVTGEEIDGGKSTIRRRRTRRRGTRGSRKRKMRQTRSRRQK